MVPPQLRGRRRASALQEADLDLAAPTQRPVEPELGPPPLVTVDGWLPVAGGYRFEYHLGRDDGADLEIWNSPSREGGDEASYVEDRSVDGIGKPELFDVHGAEGWLVNSGPGVREAFWERDGYVVSMRSHDLGRDEFTVALEAARHVTDDGWVEFYGEPPPESLGDPPSSEYPVN